MNEIVADMGSLDKMIKKTASVEEAERAAIRELVVAARAPGEDLTGPGGLLETPTKTVLETALEEEISEHLGYDCEDVVTASDLRPDPRYDRPLCLVLDLSAVGSGRDVLPPDPAGVSR